MFKHSNRFSNICNHSLLVLLAIAAITAIASGCASIGNPSGGPKDEQPPRFIKANPAPGSNNVPIDLNKITLHFNEYVNLKNPSENVVVSPPSAQIPRVTSQGHNVIVTFQDSLQPNTTYTIDFGSSIVDNNEGNKLENFSYTFSTGSSIDSLRISGIVATARDLEPLQNKIVGVHRIPDDVAEAAYKLLNTDTLIFSKRFDRVARTDDRGRFSVEGLSPGRYRIYALNDGDNNFYYSSPGEELAFSEEIIVPSTTEAVAYDSIYNLKKGKLDTVLPRQRTLFLPNNILLRSSVSKRQQQYIKKYERLDTTKLLLIMGAPMKTLPDLKIPGDSTPLYNYGIIEKRADNDSITLWLTDPKVISTDSLKVALTYPKLDSLNQYYNVTDTIRFTTDRAKLNREAQQRAKREAELQKKAQKLKEKKGGQRDVQKDNEKGAPADTITAEKPKKLLISFGTQTQEINLPYSFETNYPLARLDTSLIKLEEKIDTLWASAIKPDSKLRILRDSLNPRKYHIVHPWTFGREYRLKIDSLALTGIYGEISYPDSTTFNVRQANEYASLKMNITDWHSEIPAFAEILNSSGEVVAASSLSNNSIYFPYLLSGKYYVRIIHDYNANGKWDASDILLGEQADESYYYPKAINIKKNWNKEETWSVFATAVDLMKPEAILRNKPERKGKSVSPDKFPDEEDEDL